MPPREQIAAELGIQVRAEHVAMTKKIYDTIESEVLHLHSLHRGSTCAVYLDLPTGRAVLTSDLPRGLLEPLAQKYPDLIELKVGSIRNDIVEKARIAALEKLGHQSFDAGEVKRAHPGPSLVEAHAELQRLAC